MSHNRLSARLMCGSALAAMSLLVAGPAAAQVTGGPPSTFEAVDDNGVDLTSGELVLSQTQASVGPAGDGGVSREFAGAGLRDNLTGTINSEPDGQGGTVHTVTVQGDSARFAETSAGVITAYAGADAQTLTHDAVARTYTHTAADGAVSVFSEDKTSAVGVEATTALLTQRTRPNGERMTYVYSAGCSTACRLDAVTSNLGYMLKYEYDAADPAKLVRVTAINLANEYCAPNAGACSPASWTSTAFSGPNTGFGAVTATDSLGRVTTYTYDNGRIVQVTLPSGNATLIAYHPSGEVQTVTTPVGTWTYAYADLPENPVTHVKDRQITVTDPLGHARTYVVNGFWGRVTSVTDGLNRTSAATLDQLGRIRRLTQPEGNYVDYEYDVRGNISKVTRAPKPGSALPLKVTTIGYDASCANPKTCNQPNYIVEDNARTDFTYDPGHGGLLTVTGPAGDNGVRPQVRYSYTQLSAWYYTAPGVLGPAPSGVYRLTGVSQCMTQASCVGGADEARTVLVRGTPGTANNLQVTSETRQNGAGSLSRTTTFAYNRFGDLRNVDGPLAGAGDTTRIRYDAMRQVVGTIEADPDGQGTGRPARATRNVYTLDGDLSYSQTGSAPSQSDTDWDNAFVKVSTLAYERDQAGRIVRERINDAAGATQALTQYSFAGHRLDCVAVRMNPAVYGALPASACTASTTGSFGPDRITKFGYDNADQTVTTTEGFGTAEARTEGTSYSANGQVLSRTDGEGRVTTFEYDAFDRPWRTRFPTPGSGTTPSTTDYTQLTYDEPTWNVVAERRRDGQTVSFTYDGRNRLRTRDLPTATTYGYDNLDRPISVAAGGQTQGLTYDALGQLTGASGWNGGFTYEYDAAGRRTRMTWPDSFYVTYDYDVAGNMTAIKESGAATLATFGYDGFGRRTSLQRGNATQTTYGFDDLSRVASLNLDLAGTAQDLSRSLSYNPASEIVSRTNSNSAYAQRDRPNGRTNTVNALNQYATVNGSALSHDARGNLAFDGSTAFTYDADNRLTAVGGLALSYDPVGRLSQTTMGGVATRYAYDGLDVVGEYDAGGSLQRRYVHGPDADEPLVVYQGGSKTWLGADERGSIISQANAAGASTGVNIYGEDGVPGANNQGLFQYTGQLRLPGVVLYHYKGRAYAPVFGRFLQPDPVGYGAGMNLYAYAGNDPVNGADPLGLEDATVDELVVRGERPFKEHIDLQIRGDDPGFIEPTPQPRLERIANTKCTVQQNRATHQAEVDRMGMQLYAAGYLVTTNVSFRDPANGNKIVVADLVGSSNLSGKPAVIVEVKTGQGDFTPNQRESYPRFGTSAQMIPVGLKALMAGFIPGRPTTVVPVTIHRSGC